MKMTRSGKKRHKIFKEREEELPSFVKAIETPPEEFNVPPKARSNHYLGPIFYGDPCKEFQPPLHVLSLGAVRQVQKHNIDTFKQSIDELFYDFETVQKPCPKIKEIHPTPKRKKPYYDPYPHKCPGTRKVFPPLRTGPTKDFGTTTSIIEGETTMETPLCRLRDIPMCRIDGEPEIEFIMPSDLREERWKYLSHTERISHAHFPKRFVTVTVNGPNIPASITITRLQCKRTREYDNIFLKKEEEEKEKAQKKTTKEEKPKDDTASEAQTADEQSLKSGAFSMGTRSHASVDMEMKEDDGDEGSEGKEGKEGSTETGEVVENEGGGEMENDETDEVEKQEEEKTEEVEPQGEENPQEEEGD